MTFFEPLSSAFRRLTLTAKLLLIGLIPVGCLVFFATIIYREKTEKVDLIGSYIHHIDQASTISDLMSELGRERRFSYFYKVYDTGFSSLVSHRKVVDSLLQKLEKSEDSSLSNFRKYTFLENLAVFRQNVDSGKTTTDAITSFFTESIFRLNTLSPPFPSNKFLKSVSQDLVAEDKLSEMITYLSIVRTNVFNALLTRKYMLETLIGTVGVYRVYKSYETEFLLKASRGSIQQYNYIRKFTDYKDMTSYLEQLFTTFNFGNSYDASSWWKISTEGMQALRAQQRHLWNSVNGRLKNIYQHEQRAKEELLAFILLAIIVVIAIVLYLINHIKKILTEIKVAAAIISKGGSNTKLQKMPHGIIGNLADSIKQIEKNNLVLANAANQIGKGNFDVNVEPRSGEDVLGIAIVKMQKDLYEYASQKDRLQKETEELVYRRDEFFSIASHELKTPVTSLKAYTQLLLMDAPKHNDPQYSQMLERMDRQILKLTSLINDLLDTSKLETGQLAYKKEKVALDLIVADSIADIKRTDLQHEIVFNNETDAKVCADPYRITQVVNNFLTNAFKYADDSQKINVNLFEQDHRVVCSVQDFGKGIDEEEQRKIFERFYRVNGPNLNTYPGLGLGLFISKEIIESHGGTIGVKSVKGEGSTFYFELPVVEG